MIQKKLTDDLPDAAWVETETHRLEVAVDEFAHEMKARLRQKACEGRTGWDDPANAQEIWTTMLANAAATPLARGHEADIANFAMMLWQLSRKQAA